MIFRTLSGINRIDFIYWNLVNVICWSIALQIGVISIICQIIITLINFKYENHIKQLVFSVIVFILIAGSWTFYKNNVLERTQNFQSGWNSDLNNAFTSGTKLLVPINQDIFKNVLQSSINLTGLNAPFSREIESEGILRNAFEGCAVWYPTDNAYIAGQLQKSVITHCNFAQASSVFSRLIPIGTIFWQISNIFLWVALFALIGAYRKRASLVFLPTVLLVISYSALIFSIDRYILPTYLLALMIPARIINTLEYKYKSLRFK
jgi:4-amino-4-deoxy-L-arabinose transferase-like glycosyltransferase